MKVFKYLLLFLGFFLFEFGTGWVRVFSVTIDVPVMFLKYVLFVWFLIRKRKIGPVAVLICGISMIIVMPIVGYLVDGKISAFSLPNGVSGILGIVYGFIISRRTSMAGIRVLIPAIVALFSAWYIFGKGFDYWCQVLDGDTFTGKTEPTEVNLNWKVYNKNNDTFTSAAYAGKIVYLDFWSTSCGVCFIKFPELENLYQAYKDDSRVLIQAVNIPIERDTAGMAFYMIGRNAHYNFPVVIGSESMRTAFGVEAYPTVVILKDNKMVFRGRTELAKDALEDILETSGSNIK